MSRTHSPAQTMSDPALPEAMRRALANAPAPDYAHGFPWAWWRHLGASDLLGMGFSQDGGPPVADAAQLSVLAGSIAHETASLGLGMAWMMQQILGRFVLAPNLRSDRHRTLLASMARGDALLALAISEPGVGAHPKHLSCRAVQDGGDWILDGHKAFVSNGPAADAIIVLAINGEHEGRKRFDAFVVEANTPGLTREGDGKVTGLAPLGHCGLRLVGCRVPDSQRLGEPGQAFDTIARPLRAIEDALLLGAMLGAMQAELDALARWFRNAARSPALTRDLGGLQLELDALSPVARHAAQHLDQHGPDEALAAFNLGARRLFDRWQGACESFAAALDDHVSIHAPEGANLKEVTPPPSEFYPPEGGGFKPELVFDEPALLTLARDLRLVLGIARGIAESRQLQAGGKMLLPQGNP